ncbi:hypothetical protein PV08_05788 [Exophiala spinifera]|uniref:Uncharacterized protein n=1 Tax=Exophiala spinifera TaxID=91928 RepID=A0A0D2B9S3_9EURO|nr:uncharacterized protein PV08_05788 [Exophiala spinifera]KIW15738.1 hypothetical protein PV08_05788 [Exophiala spinifera]
MNTSNDRVASTPSGCEDTLRMKRTGTRLTKTQIPVQVAASDAGQPQPQNTALLGSHEPPSPQLRTFSEVVSGKAPQLSATNYGESAAGQTTLGYEEQNHHERHQGHHTRAFRAKETSTWEEDFPSLPSKATPPQRHYHTTTHKALSNSGAAIPFPGRAPSNKPVDSSRSGATHSRKGRHEEQIQIYEVDREPEVKPFRFDEYDLRLRCRKPDCRKMTSCWDYSVVICPGCGPNSYVRYCSRQHLYDDIQYHWVYHCGRHRITDNIERTTIRPHQNPHRPYALGKGFNSVERHRQAVYRSLEPGDFFLFDDVGLLKPDFIEPTPEQWYLMRGTGPCVFQLFFPDDMTNESRRNVFNTTILECLGVGFPRAEKSCLTALHLVRESFILTGNWTEQMLNLLCLQLAGEWGGFKVPESFYNVKAANLAWRRHRILPPTP